MEIEKKTRHFVGAFFVFGRGCGKIK